MKSPCAPAERSRRRFEESFYFKFKSWGSRAGDECVAQVRLPSYAINSISTGRVVLPMVLIRAKRYGLYETEA